QSFDDRTRAQNAAVADRLLFLVAPTKPADIFARKMHDRIDAFDPFAGRFVKTGFDVPMNLLVPFRFAPRRQQKLIAARAQTFDKRRPDQTARSCYQNFHRLKKLPSYFVRGCRMPKYSCHGPTAASYCFAITRAICAMWSRS